ncbi:MAG: TolC family protein [Bacteroidetes bacterium]|nr:TolC family protein [Bacteroidota bacterium]MBS1933252.1 TolC family protein [Bacteroidota bacterium]
MKKLQLLWAFCCLTLLSANAQDKWDLRKCVEFAIANNISVKQADVQARISALQYKSAKLNQYPSAGFSSGLGTQFGRSIDPTTNQFTTTQLLYQNLGLQGGIQLFGFGQLRKARDAANFNLQAALADVQRASNDIALSVANYYLQVLAANEQINIAKIVIAQDSSQIHDTRARVDAGTLPELNLLEVEAQLASDSSALIGAQATYEQTVLSLKGVLNLDAAAPFEPEIPPVDRIPLDPIAELQPDYVYKLALTNQPLQKENDLKIKGQQKTIEANKAAMYPNLTFGYSLASSFSNTLKAINVTQGTPSYVPAAVVIDGSGTPINGYYVGQPNYNYSYSPKSFGNWWQGYGDQMNNNFRQAVGFTLNVPIFNSGNTYRINYETSKLNLKNLELQKQQADITLKINIYTAYSNAVSSMEKFRAGIKTVESAQKVYDFSMRRYEVGLLGTIDLLTNQNNLLKAKLQQVANQYDYVFKMKVLEFYKGMGIKL